MKKIVSLLLVLVSLLSLTACGGNSAPTDTTTTPDNSTTAPVVSDNENNATETTPSAPTEAEKELLEEYARIATWVSGVCIPMNWAEEYQKLISMDKSVIYRWRDTEYAPAVYANDPVNWDIDEVLSKFICFENVQLNYVYTRSDRLGNTETTTTKEIGYEESGLIAMRAGYEPFDTDGYYNSGYRIYTKDDTGRIMEVRYTSHPQYGNVTVEELLTLTYDDNGNKIKETVSNKYGVSEEIDFFYDSNNRLIQIVEDEGDRIRNFAYDDEGRLVQSEYLFYINGCLYTRTTDQYTYDEKGHLKSNTNNFYGYSDGEVERRSTDVYTYTCDENGNVVKVEIVNGDLYYCSGYKEGEVQKPIYVQESYEIIYGDYYLYTDDQRPRDL